MRLVSGQQHYKRHKLQRSLFYSTWTGNKDELIMGRKRMQQVERKDGPENVKMND